MKHEINLLPVNLSETKSNHLKKTASMIIWGVVLIMILASYIVLSILDQLYISKINSTEVNLKNQNGDVIDLESLADLNKSAKQRELILAAVSDEKNIPLQSLAEIQKAVPLDMKIINLDYSNETIEIDAETKKHEDILLFKEQLSKCDLFDQIQMITSNKKNVESDGKGSSLEEDSWEFSLEIIRSRVVQNE